MAGITNSSISYSSGTAEKVGSYDPFIVKLDPLGEILWAGNFGASGHDECFSLELDSEGNLLLAGYFRGDWSIGEDTYTAQGTKYPDGFLLKIDTEGQVLWSIAGGKGSTELFHDIRLDADDNIFVVGEQDHTYDFGGTEVVGSGTTVAKVASDGTVIWAKCLGDSGGGGRGIEFGPEGNLFVAGYGGGKMQVQHLDAETGDLIWQKRYAGGYC